MKIKIMYCSWNKSFENKQLEVEKIPTKEPTIKQLLFKLVERVDKIERRLDEFEQKIERRMEEFEQKIDQKIALLCKINNLKLPNEN